MTLLFLLSVTAAILFYRRRRKSSPSIASSYSVRTVITDETRAAVARDLERIRAELMERDDRLKREMRADADRLRTQRPDITPDLERLRTQAKPSNTYRNVQPPAPKTPQRAPQTRPLPKVSRRLIELCNGNHSTAQRLVIGYLDSNPGKSDNWANEKAIYDLERDWGAR